MTMRKTMAVLAIGGSLIAGEASACIYTNCFDERNHEATNRMVYTNRSGNQREILIVNQNISARVQPGTSGTVAALPFRYGSGVTRGVATTAHYRMRVLENNRTVCEATGVTHWDAKFLTCSINGPQTGPCGATAGLRPARNGCDFNFTN